MYIVFKNYWWVGGYQGVCVISGEEMVVLGIVGEVTICEQMTENK